MNSNDINDYNPAEDDNQGVAQLLSQAQESNDGVPQAGGINPISAQGPEPVKEEVNNDSDTDANSVSDNLLDLKDVENGGVQTDDDDEE